MIDTLKDTFYFFENGLSHRFCDNVVKHGLSKKFKQAVIGGKTLKNTPKKELDFVTENIRNFNTNWSSQQWLYKELRPFINFANKETGWNFQHDWIESLQFTKYEKGQFYTTHTDVFKEPFKHKNKNFANKITKLSVTCQLSDPNDYEGGELVFTVPQLIDGKTSFAEVTCEQFLPKGTVIVFPSFMWHRVNKVTKGVRYSLVSWILGCPFI